MKPNDGNPVTGEDFFNRTEELKRLRQHLENKQHLNLMSPRRCGKTSIMREVMRRMQIDGWATLEIDFAGCSSIQAFFTKLASKLDEAIEGQSNQGETLLKKSKKLLGSVRDVKVWQFGVSIAGKEEQSFAEVDRALRALLTELAQSSVKKELIFGTDEIPVFLTRMLVAAQGNEEQLTQTRSEISAFLYWMRELRQTDELPVTFIHCGSIGIENIVSGLGLTHALSGLNHQTIDAFSDDHSRGLIEALSKPLGMKIGQDIQDHILNRIEWQLPYFIQILLIKLDEPRDLTRRQSEDYPTTDDVDAAYNQILEEGKIHFKHWETRLTEQLTKTESRLARDLLQKIAPSGVSGIEREQIIAETLSVQQQPATQEDAQKVRESLSLLVHDGYLRRTSDDVYHFRSPMLRDYWLRELC